MAAGQPVTPPAELLIAHTADLGADTRQAARALLDVSRALTCDWREGDAW